MTAETFGRNVTAIFLSFGVPADRLVSAERSNFGRNFHFRLGTEVISAEIGGLEVLISAENAYFGRNFSFGISAESAETFR